MNRVRPWVAYLAVVTLMLLSSIPTGAQSDSQILGTLSVPFTTLSVDGDLAHPGELDWYTFHVTGGAMTVYILTQSDDESIRALLFDGNDDYLATTESGYLETVLNAGSYRVRIDSVGSVVQGYSLIILNGIETESNDGLTDSNDLGTITSSIQLYASMLPSGDADFYRFAVPGTGLANGANALLIRTSGPEMSDTMIVLYRFDETVNRYLPVASDDDSGDTYWSQLLVRPQPGDRFALRIEETTFPLEGIEVYNLSVVPVTLTVDIEPNNTAAQATPLHAQDEPATSWMSEGILDEDSIDFFSLTIDSPTLVQLATESQNAAGDYDTLLSLYGLDGTLLAQSDDSGDGGWSRISLSLQPGDYIIAVEMDEYQMPPLPYRLRAVATSVRTVAETEPNDTDENAEPIEWSAGEALLIEATIGVEGDVDSYVFELTESTTLTIETGPPSGSSESSDTTLAIYDAELWQIASNDDSNGSWSRIEQTLPAGTYYVVVESYFSDETFGYALLITESP